MVTTMIYDACGDSMSVGNTSIEITTTDGSATYWGSYQSPIEVCPLEEWVCASSSAIYKKEEVREMRGLFQFYVVDPEKGEVVGDGLVIAKNKETAKIKALAPFADKYDLDDLDIICNRLGDVREKKEVQEVKIVK